MIRQLQITLVALTGIGLGGVTIGWGTGILPPPFVSAPPNLPPDLHRIDTDELRLLLVGNSLSNFVDGKIQFFKALHFGKNGEGYASGGPIENPFIYKIYNNMYCMNMRMKKNSFGRVYWKCRSIYSNSGNYYQYSDKIGFYRVSIRQNVTGEIK